MKRCECWWNPETGYTECCPEHEAEVMDHMMDFESARRRKRTPNHSRVRQYVERLTAWKARNGAWIRQQPFLVLEREMLFEKCGAFGHPHIYHCSPAGGNPWRPPKTHRTLCLQIRAALIHYGWTQDEIAERYGKDC